MYTLAKSIRFFDRFDFKLYEKVVKAKKLNAPTKKVLTFKTIYPCKTTN
jgi:hypothetical protein